MLPPNEFQLLLMQKIYELAAAQGLSSKQEVQADVFEYEKPAVKIVVGDYTFWIYPDGAEVSGPKLDKRFEVESYNSLHDLQSDYLAFIQSLQRQSRFRQDP